ncbi:MAG: hypothetical protein IH605_11585 [Burkholderiales bacterium]|nr:hypothetical protein [Burkholderiales bacterium]
MLSDIIFGLIAMTMAVVFYLVPIVKLVPILGTKSIPLVAVVMIGVVMMIVEFVQTIRAGKDDSKK